LVPSIVIPTLLHIFSSVKGWYIWQLSGCNTKGLGLVSPQEYKNNPLLADSIFKVKDITS
jgi:hypothetical protein